jgi:hypothetical protein
VVGTLLGTGLALLALGAASAVMAGLSVGLNVWLWAAVLPFTLPLLAGLTAWMVALRLLRDA